MTIQVKTVSSGWSPPNANADFPPIYTLTLEGHGEPQKTQDPALATVGTHEAETYQTRSGKTYWRSLDAPQAPERTFKADPLKQESITWQTCLKAAVEAVRDYHTFNPEALPTSLADYKKAIVETVVTFTQTLEKKPDHIEPLETMVDMGDFAAVELPPVEVYEGQ